MTNSIEQVEAQEVEQDEQVEAQTEALTDQEILEGVEVDVALADAEAAIAQHEEEVQVTEKPKRAKKEKAPKEPKAPKAVSTKTFTVAGLSVHKGELKLRFANDLQARIKVLDKNGHEEIRLVEFEAGTKQELAQQLAAHADFQDAAAQEVILAAVGE